MKASELRIGNLVSTKDGIVEVEEISDDGVNGEAGFEWVKYEYEYIKPIPLTEEWLVKYGARIIKDEIADCAIFDRASLRMVYNDKDWHCSLGYDDCGILFRMIKYVHQLQNLYFALTDKELKL